MNPPPLEVFRKFICFGSSTRPILIVVVENIHNIFAQKQKREKQQHK